MAWLVGAWACVLTMQGTGRLGRRGTTSWAGGGGARSGVSTS